MGLTTKGQSVLSKDSLFSRGLRRKNVYLPEHGEGAFLIVQELTGEQRDEYDASLWRQRKRSKFELSLDHATAKLVALSVINEDGSRMFGDDEIKSLSRKVGASTLKRLAEAAKELSGITDDEIEELSEAKK